jgi:hypothetical protein
MSLDEAELQELVSIDHATAQKTVNSDRHHALVA